ncbi:MAG TPA: hypothetical protein VLB49_00675 [Gemmatimonadales bacterium]|nr:hypothetical protein [Gemmatimonadales bacterium]
MRASLTLVALALVAAPAPAQNQAPADSGFWQKVLNLPKTVDEGRQAGIPSGTIWGVLDSLRRARVPAEDAQVIVQDEVDAVKAGAPKDNFGATVNALLARGLRGRELAAAIHAEHARRGIGKGKGKGQGQGRGRKP